MTRRRDYPNAPTLSNVNAGGDTVAGITVECWPCKRGTSFPLASLIQTFGPDQVLYKLLTRYSCNVCGKRAEASIARPGQINWAEYRGNPHWRDLPPIRPEPIKPHHRAARRKSWSP